MSDVSTVPVEDIIEDLTPEEIPWVESLKRSQKQIDDPVIDKKSQEYLYVNRYNKFLRLVLKYHNLRTDYLYDVPYKRLIKLHKVISMKELEKLGVEYVILDGIYVVSTVRFIDINKYEEFMKNPTFENAKRCGLGNIKSWLMKKVTFKTGECAAVVIDDLIMERYVFYGRDWDYLQF